MQSHICIEKKSIKNMSIRQPLSYLYNGKKGWRGQSWCGVQYVKKFR